jgi:hypothetical protein
MEVKNHETLSSTLDGTCSKKWKEAQKDNLPKHLISTEQSPDPGTFLCTCGVVCSSIETWSIHATKREN